MTVITVCNQKGGVGKSTIALTLGVALNALMIDLDPQGNLTYAAGGETHDRVNSWELLAGDTNPKNLIQHTANGDLIGATERLALADIELNHDRRRGQKLKERITPLKGIYEYIVIDPPPSLGSLVINSLMASDYVLIPVQADIFSLHALKELRKTIESVKAINTDLTILGIVLNRHNPRTILSRDIVDALAQMAEQLDTVLLDSTIREAVAVKEAQVTQTNIFNYAPNSKVANDFESLIKEVRERM